jgi:hypothetical protein
MTDKLNGMRPMKRLCVVIMPFSPVFAPIWEDVIRPTVEEFGDICQRDDNLYEAGPVLERLLRLIRDSNYLIADLTSRNANVFYEFGYAHAMGKTVILLTQNEDDVPFDLRHLRVIKYSDTVAGASHLRAMLKRFLSALD